MAFNVLAEYVTGANSTDLTLAHINSDSQLDLVVANDSATRGQVRLGNADGLFQGPQSTGVTSTSQSTGDLTGDGITDLVSIGSSVMLQAGNGDGTFMPPQAISLPPQVAPGNPNTTSLPQSPRSIATGDLNADGKLDLIVVGQTDWSEYRRILQCGDYTCFYYSYWYTHTDGYVNVLIGDGHGFDSPVTYPLERSSAAIATGDLNGDGNTDVLTAGSSGLNAMIGNGTGALAAPIHSESDTLVRSGTLLKAVSLGDVDGDGRLDALTGWNNTLTVQKGRGDGTFTPLNLVTTGHSVDSAIMGDVNGDGALDLVAVGSAYNCTNSGYYGCYDGVYHGQSSVILGNGAGGLSLPITSALGTDFNGWFVDVALADLTGDSLLDLVTIERSTGLSIVASNGGDWVQPVILSISSPSVVEGHGGTVMAVFNLMLDNPSTRDVTVEYATADLNATEEYWYGGPTATAGVDYTAKSGTLTIPAGQTSGTINVPVSGDRIGEANELFLLNLSNPTFAVVSNSPAMGMIIDDEPYVSFEYYSRPEVTEGNSGTKPMTFMVELSAASDVPVTVDYFIQDGSATAGSDYQAATGILTIPAGQTTGIITAQVIGDAQPESDEYFTVNLVNASNAKLGESIKYGYINDDDSVPMLSISDAYIVEGNSGTRQMTFSVTLSQASNQTVSVNYKTANGTAKSSNNDYVSKSGTIAFSPGQTTKTITITIKGDKMKESDEQFYVNLSGASGASIADGQGVGTIANDDGVSSRSTKSVAKYAAAVDAVMDELITGRAKARRR